MTIESPVMPSNAQRLDGIQILRALAALAVVISHLVIIETKYSPDRLLGDWANIGASGVDLFFVISGFIMVYVTQDRDRLHNKPAGFLANRALRIYPLYWAISGALLCVWLYRPDIVFSSAAGEPNLIKSFLLWPDARDPLLAVGWTLIHELYFYAVFAVFLIFARKWLLLCLLMWGLMIAGAIALDASPARPETRLILSPLTLEFILGAIAGLIFIRAKGKGSALLLGLGLILYLASCYILSRESAPDFHIQMIRVSYFAIPAALITYGMAGCLAEKSRIAMRLQKWGVKLGDWSYALYLSHILSLSLAGRIWSKFSREGLWDNIFMLAIMIAFAIFVAAIAHLLFEKPALNISRKALRRLRLRG